MPLEFSRVQIDAALVSLAAAKDHARIPQDDTAHDADVQLKLDAAQELIVAKLGAAADPAWTEETAPRVVRHAILIAFDAFNERRGGDENKNTDHLRASLAAVDALLALYRDPALA